jgi:hypothetical protein
MIRRAGILTGQFQSGLQQLLRPAFSPTIIAPRLKISKKRLELRQIFLIAIAVGTRSRSLPKTNREASRVFECCEDVRDVYKVSSCLV